MLKTLVLGVSLLIVASLCFFFVLVPMIEWFDKQPLGFLVFVVVGTLFSMALDDPSSDDDPCDPAAGL